MKLYKTVQLRIKVEKQYNQLITGDEITNGVLDRVKEAFEKVETQPDSVEKYGGLDKGPATYGVVKKLRDNDMELHTNKQVRLICSMLFVIFQVLFIASTCKMGIIVLFLDVFVWLTCSKNAQR